MAKAYLATGDAIVTCDGETHYIRKGTTRVVEGHKILKEHPELFKPAEDGADIGTPATARQEPHAPRSRNDAGETKKSAAKKSAKKD